MFRPKVEYNAYFSIIYILVFLIALFQYGFTNDWLVSYLIHFLVGSFGLAFGYHRLIIHRCIDSYSVVKHASAFIAILSNTGSAITWGTSHYLHHMYPDTENDPHSPMTHQYRILLGFFNTDAIMKNQKKVFSAIRYIARDSVLVHMHNYYYLYLLSYLLIVWGIWGIKGLFFYGIIPSGFSYYSIILTNYFNHGRLGYINFDTKDLSRNVWFMFPLTFGENWHNNHHEFPNSVKTWIRWWEIDIPYLYCIIFNKKNYIRLNYILKRIKSVFVSKPNDYVY